MARHRILGIFALFACMLFARPSLAQQSRELWVVRHDGSLSGNDSAAAIAVDSSGNSYVTGSIQIQGVPGGQFTTFSWETVKYDTNGNALWAASFAGTEDCASGPSAIAVDAHGNSYVTGSVCVAAACDELGCFESYSDYATIKYAPNGAQLWVARYPESARGVWNEKATKSL